MRGLREMTDRKKFCVMGRWLRKIVGYLWGVVTQESWTVFPILHNN